MAAIASRRKGCSSPVYPAPARPGKSAIFWIFSTKAGHSFQAANLQDLFAAFSIPEGGLEGSGRKTLRALGYPISEKSRLSQAEIWERVVFQAEVQGVVGIHYDEAQHILRKKPDGERLAILNSFKTLMKSNDWPLILILSGVPELANYVREEPQLFRLMTQVSFGDINLTSMGEVPAGDYQFVHEIVGSFALEAGLAVDDDLLGLEFYHRLVTAGAFRWGLLIRLTLHAVSAAVADGAVDS